LQQCRPFLFLARVTPGSQIFRRYIFLCSLTGYF